MLPGELIARLTCRRRLLGLKQTELAPRVGVSLSELGRWERRKCWPTLPAFCAWVEELGLDIVLAEPQTGLCPESTAPQTPPS